MDADMERMAWLPGALRDLHFQCAAVRRLLDRMPASYDRDCALAHVAYMDAKVHAVERAEATVVGDGTPGVWPHKRDLMETK